MKGSSARKNKQTNKLCSGSLNTSVYLCYSAKLPPGWVKSTVYVETTEQNKSQYTHLLSYIKNDMLIISFVRMYKKTTILQSRDGYFHKALNIDRRTESCGWRKKKKSQWCTVYHNQMEGEMWDVVWSSLWYGSATGRCNESAFRTLTLLLKRHQSASYQRIRKQRH